MLEQGTVLGFYASPDDVYAKVKELSEAGTSILKKQKGLNKNDPAYLALNEELIAIESAMHELEKQMSFLKKG